MPILHVSIIRRVRGALNALSNPDKNLHPQQTTSVATVGFHHTALTVHVSRSNPVGQCVGKGPFSLRPLGITSRYR
jgi:hypothetical protein